MESSKIKKITDNIINNSVDEVREFREFHGKDEEWLKSLDEYEKTIEKIKEVLKSQGMEKLIFKLDEEVGEINLHIEEFYYKEGLRDGLTKLRFLNEINDNICRFF